MSRIAYVVAPRSVPGRSLLRPGTIPTSGAAINPAAAGRIAPAALRHPRRGVCLSRRPPYRTPPIPLVEARRLTSSPAPRWRPRSAFAELQRAVGCRAGRRVLCSGPLGRRETGCCARQTRLATWPTARPHHNGTDRLECESPAIPVETSNKRVIRPDSSPGEGQRTPGGRCQPELAGVPADEQLTARAKLSDAASSGGLHAPCGREVLRCFPSHRPRLVTAIGYVMFASRRGSRTNAPRFRVGPGRLPPR